MKSEDVIKKMSSLLNLKENYSLSSLHTILTQAYHIVKYESINEENSENSDDSDNENDKRDLIKLLSNSI